MAIYELDDSVYGSEESLPEKKELLSGMYSKLLFCPVFISHTFDNMITLLHCLLPGAATSDITIEFYQYIKKFQK